MNLSVSKFHPSMNVVVSIYRCARMRLLSLRFEEYFG